MRSEPGNHSTLGSLKSCPTPATLPQQVSQTSIVPLASDFSTLVGCTAATYNPLKFQYLPRSGMSVLCQLEARFAL
jgi:hypothetical protein